MSLISRITALAQAVGADVKALYANQGSLAALSTTAKNSLVAAINEVLTVAQSASGGGATINDASTTSTTQTWSASKIKSYADGIQSAILGSASAAYDTLQEIQAFLESDASSISGLLTAVGNRIRFDAAQTLTSGQITQACTNIGVGEPDTDFVSAYNTAKA